MLRGLGTAIWLFFERHGYDFGNLYGTFPDANVLSNSDLDALVG